jgi:Tfp pilus assembly pilus retraction ATPase PilT
MQINISQFTLPDDFHEITDFYIPEEAPMMGIVFPGRHAIQLDRKPEYHDIVSFMLEEAKKKERLEFSLELNHEGSRIIMRGHSIVSVEGKVFIFRRLPSHIPNIETIGMPLPIIELLKHERLNTGGLVIIAGETGQGKSTTAAAAIAYRLRHYGCFCLTIEDPVELPLQGFYEDADSFGEKMGVCFQTNVESEKIFDAIKSSLRCYPSVSNSILFLGETRDSVMASEVLKIAANGHLVITTMHGSELMTSLKRFISLAGERLGMNEAQSMFSSVFRLMIHQRMEMKQDGTKRIRPNVIFSPDSASSVASRLRSGNIEMLATEIQTQNVAINRGNSLFSSDWLNKKN